MIATLGAVQTICRPSVAATIPVMPGGISEADGYSCTTEFGLKRTPFDTSQPRQIMNESVGLMTSRVSVFSLSFTFDVGGLRQFEAFARASGAAWFSTSLMLDGRIQTLLVRPIEAPIVSSDGFGIYRVTLNVEGYAPADQRVSLLSVQVVTRAVEQAITMCVAQAVFLPQPSQRASCVSIQTVAAPTLYQRVCFASVQTITSTGDYGT